MDKVSCHFSHGLIGAICSALADAPFYCLTANDSDERNKKYKKKYIFTLLHKKSSVVERKREQK